MAERQGFEPWDVLLHQWFSRPPRSSTPAPLRGGKRVLESVALRKGEEYSALSRGLKSVVSGLAGFVGPVEGFLAWFRRWSVLGRRYGSALPDRDCTG